MNVYERFEFQAKSGVSFLVARGRAERDTGSAYDILQTENQVVVTFIRVINFS